MSVQRYADSPKKIKLFIRLTSEINDHLRSLLRYRGDLSRFIEEALKPTDLYKVALLAPRGSPNLRGTTASTDRRVSASLKSAAIRPRCSANWLANSAIAAWLRSR